jgi:hypothetical protein
VFKRETISRGCIAFPFFRLRCFVLATSTYRFDVVLAEREAAIRNSKARADETYDRLMDIGIQGDTALMQLPGAVWDAFWVPGCAHLALLGVVNDLDELLKRENKEKLAHGNEYRLRNATYIRGPSMQGRNLEDVRKLRRTSLYKRGFENIVACVASLLRRVLPHAWNRRQA